MADARFGESARRGVSWRKGSLQLQNRAIVTPKLWPGVFLSARHPQPHSSAPPRRSSWRLRQSRTRSAGPANERVKEPVAGIGARRLLTPQRPMPQLRLTAHCSELRAPLSSGAFRGGTPDSRLASA
ncbi:hypothetical protein AOLI_G00184730 [Acnodon oligacanthus]